MWCRKKNLLLFALASLSVLMPNTSTADDGSMSLGLTAEYTTGDYGTANTTQIWYFPLTVSYETTRSLFRLTVPYIIMRGTGEVVISTGGHHVVTKQTTTRTTTESGLGDLLFSASYMLLPETRSRPMLDLTARYKLATADEEKNLGTGENDLALQLELAKTFNQVMVFGGGGRKFLGDPPGTELDDILFGYVGAEYLLNDNKVAGLMFDYGEASTQTGVETRELTFYINKRLNGGKRLHGYLLMGLSDGSPDWGAGIGIKFHNWR